MEQKPRNLASGKRMDGLGPSGPKRPASPPLDLRPPATPEQAKLDNAAIPVRKAAPTTLSRPQPSSARPQRSSHYGDPLEGLLDDHHDFAPAASASAEPVFTEAPASAREPRKKGGFWRGFWRFVLVLLILLALISAGWFVYVNYFQSQ